MENNIGKKIKQLRICHGIKQQQLADALGVSKSLISAYEKGIRNPSLKVLQAMSDYFGAKLFGDDNLLHEEYDRVILDITYLTSRQQTILCELYQEFKKNNTEVSLE